MGQCLAGSVQSSSLEEGIRARLNRKEKRRQDSAEILHSVASTERASPEARSPDERNPSQAKGGIESTVLSVNDESNGQAGESNGQVGESNGQKPEMDEQQTRISTLGISVGLAANHEELENAAGADVLRDTRPQPAITVLRGAVLKQPRRRGTDPGFLGSVTDGNGYSDGVAEVGSVTGKAVEGRGSSFLGCMGFGQRFCGGNPVESSDRSGRSDRDARGDRNGRAQDPDGGAGFAGRETCDENAHCHPTGRASHQHGPGCSAKHRAGSTCSSGSGKSCTGRRKSHSKSGSEKNHNTNGNQADGATGVHTCPESRACTKEGCSVAEATLGDAGRGSPRASSAASITVVDDFVAKDVISVVNREAYAVRVHAHKSVSSEYDVDSNSVLGSGYSGPVRSGRHRLTGNEVAIKTFKKASLSSKRLAFLRNEIRVYLRLDHPNICRLLDVFEDADSVHLVMEHCSGRELYHRLVSRKQFTEADAACCTYQMLLAVRYLHEHGICHRDLKLENFLYADSSQNAKLKLIDFGFSKVWDPKVLMHRSCGSVLYVAPEVLSGNYTLSCDMWSIGVIVYMLLSGSPPFKGADQELLNNIVAARYSLDTKRMAGVSESARAFIRALLVADPSSRMSASAAIAHPWITRHIAAAQGVTPSSPIASSGAVPLHVLENLRQFAMHNHLQRAVMSIVAYSFTSDEIRQLHDYFFALDVERSGTIKMTQLVAAMKDTLHITTEEVEYIFDKLDRDHDGEIEYSSFIAAMLMARIRMHEGYARLAFNRLDVNGTGRVSIGNLSHIFGDTIEGEYIGVLLKESDLKGDGTIDFDEFIQALGQPPQGSFDVIIKERDEQRRLSGIAAKEKAIGTGKENSVAHEEKAVADKGKDQADKGKDQASLDMPTLGTLVPDQLTSDGTSDVSKENMLTMGNRLASDNLTSLDLSSVGPNSAGLSPLDRASPADGSEDLSLSGLGVLAINTDNLCSSLETDRDPGGISEHFVPMEQATAGARVSSSKDSLHLSNSCLASACEQDSTTIVIEGLPDEGNEKDGCPGSGDQHGPAGNQNGPAGNQNDPAGSQDESPLRNEEIADLDQADLGQAELGHAASTGESSPSQQDGSSGAMTTNSNTKTEMRSVATKDLHVLTVESVPSAVSSMYLLAQYMVDQELKQQQ